MIRKSIPQLRLEGFVSTNTLHFFQRLKLSMDFLAENRQCWAAREDYLLAELMVRCLKVTNDNAERGIALTEEYNRLITRDKDQLQFLLQIVAEHHRSYPDSCKATLIERQFR